jgi:hypothetical protein
MAPGHDLSEFHFILEKHGAKLIEKLTNLDIYIVEIDEYASLEFMDELDDSPHVNFAGFVLPHKNCTIGIVSDAPLYNMQQRTAYERMGIDIAWTITKGDPNLLIGIFDSGIDALHPGFAGKIHSTWGYPSWLWGTANHQEMLTDNEQHGTMCSSIVANGYPIEGIASGCTLFPIKANSTDGHFGNSIAGTVALVAASTNPSIKILSMSFGTVIYGQKYPVLQENILYSTRFKIVGAIATFTNMGVLCTNTNSPLRPVYGLATSATYSGGKTTFDIFFYDSDPLGDMNNFNEVEFYDRTLELCWDQMWNNGKLGFVASGNDEKNLMNILAGRHAVQVGSTINGVLVGNSNYGSHVLIGAESESHWSLAPLNNAALVTTKTFSVIFTAGSKYVRLMSEPSDNLVSRSIKCTGYVEDYTMIIPNDRVPQSMWEVKMSYAAKQSGTVNANFYTGYVATGGSGTSFASPNAAAIAALVWSANPSLTNAQVLDCIFSTGDTSVNYKPTTGSIPGDKKWFTYGLANAGAAVRKAINYLHTDPYPLPSMTITQGTPVTLSTYKPSAIYYSTDGSAPNVVAAKSVKLNISMTSAGFPVIAVKDILFNISMTPATLWWINADNLLANISMTEAEFDFNSVIVEANDIDFIIGFGGGIITIDNMNAQIELDNTDPSYVCTITNFESGTLDGWVTNRNYLSTFDMWTVSNTTPINGTYSLVANNSFSNWRAVLSKTIITGEGNISILLKGYWTLNTFPIFIRVDGVVYNAPVDLNRNINQTFSCPISSGSHLIEICASTTVSQLTIDNISVPIKMPIKIDSFNIDTYIKSINLINPNIFTLGNLDTNISIPDVSAVLTGGSLFIEDLNITTDLPLIEIYPPGLRQDLGSAGWTILEGAGGNPLPLGNFSTGNYTSVSMSKTLNISGGQDFIIAVSGGYADTVTDEGVDSVIASVDVNGISWFGCSYSGVYTFTTPSSVTNGLVTITAYSTGDGYDTGVSIDSIAIPLQ